MNGARHATLLVDGEDRTHGAVLLHVAKDVQDDGYADAVVRSETRALGVQDIALFHKPDGVVQRIIRDARRSDADHVHMPLQDDARRILSAGRSGKIGDDIVPLILHDRKPHFPQMCKEIVADRLLVPRGTRNRGEGTKFFHDIFQDIALLHKSLLLSIEKAGQSSLTALP